MSKTAAKLETRRKTAARADQLRPLNVPQRVKVELDDTGLPAAVVAGYRPTMLPPYRPQADEDQSERMESEATGKSVESIIEVWRVDDEWWREPISRRCVEVILEGGKHVVLYEDLTTNDWFMQRP